MALQRDDFDPTGRFWTTLHFFVVFTTQVVPCEQFQGFLGLGTLDDDGEGESRGIEVNRLRSPASFGPLFATCLALVLTRHLCK